MELIRCILRPLAVFTQVELPQQRELDTDLSCAHMALCCSSDRSRHCSQAHCILGNFLMASEVPPAGQGDYRRKDHTLIIPLPYPRMHLVPVPFSGHGGGQRADKLILGYLSFPSWWGSLPQPVALAKPGVVLPVRAPGGPALLQDTGKESLSEMNLCSSVPSSCIKTHLPQVVGRAYSARCLTPTEID